MLYQSYERYYLFSRYVFHQAMNHFMELLELCALLFTSSNIGLQCVDCTTDTIMKEWLQFDGHTVGMQPKDQCS